MRKGVIYARYSSHAQREESIEQQVEECRLFAAQNDIQIMEVYADKAISGKTDKRASFQRLMRDAAKRKWEVVVAYKSNRIARNMLNALTYESKLAEFGVETLYAKEEFGNTAAGRFALRTMMNVNQFYSENMAEDIKRGLRDNAERHLVNGSLPFGYRRGENGEYEVDEAQAEIVREIFTRYASGEQFVSIERDLNVRGVKTKRGGTWNKGSYHRMLKNVAYIGTYHHSGVVAEDAIPAIVDKALFDAVQAKLSELRPYAKNYGYILTGKLFCGHCGSPMVGTSGKTVDGIPQYHYYSCQGKRLRHNCDKRHEIKDDLERRVAELTRDVVLQDDFIEWIAEQTVALCERAVDSSELTRLESERREKDKARRNMLSAIEQGIITESTKARLAELEREVEDLSDRIARFKALHKPIEKDRIIFALHKFREESLDSPDFCKTLIRSFVERVVVWDDRLEITYRYAQGDASELSPQSYSSPLTPPITRCTNFVVVICPLFFSVTTPRL